MEVIGHEAGVRPIIRNSRPIVGFHSKHSNVGFFNGLGSKGTLMAPAVAAHFAAFLCGECELDNELKIP
jgi:glycine/D-amino acid oxidase-like deaminating enzyme